MKRKTEQQRENLRARIKADVLLAVDANVDRTKVGYSERDAMARETVAMLLRHYEVRDRRRR